MKYLIILLLLGGCSVQEAKEPCSMYEEYPYVTKEYFRYPAEGYIERVEYRFRCVK